MDINQAVGNRRENPDTVLLAVGLLLLGSLSYGLTMGKLGYFLDDWYIIWTYKVFGTDKFIDFFLRDRPLFSYVYRAFIPLIKDSPLSWQIFAIFTKWLSAMALWWLLKFLLPEKKWFTYAVAALFLVYPGFKFHYFVVMYSQAYALFAIYLLSYIFMVLALRNPERRALLTGAAMVCQFIGIAPQEYFFGLELVRPVLLFLAIPKDKKTVFSKLLHTLGLYLPYLAVVVGFTAFRVLRSDLYSYQIGFINQIKAAPLETIKNLMLQLIKGLYDSSAAVWIELVNNHKTTENKIELLSRVPLILIAFLLSLFLQYRTNHNERNSVSGPKTPLLLFLLGIYAVLVGMIPFLVAGFLVNNSFYNTRFLLPLSIGASLLVVSLVEIVPANKLIKWSLVALIIGLSVDANHMNGLAFQKAWEDQRDFFAQLVWRAPQIKPGTVVITPDVPFEQFFSGTSLTAPLNMIYAPELHDNPIPYQVILASSIQMNSMPDLLPDQPINRPSRVFRFIGNTSNMVTVYMPAQGCLKVVSPSTDPNAFTSSGRFELWTKLIPLSNLARIDTDAPSAILPREFFGEVSTNTWCYYYQRAALAEQKGEWSEVVSLYAEARANDLAPEDASEWLPWIKAIIQLNEIDTALELSDNIEVDDAFTNLGLCTIWQKDELSLTPTQQQTVGIMLEQWQCEDN